MNTVESNATKMRMPSGRVFWISSAVATAARATSRLFAVEVLTMPIPRFSHAVAAEIGAPLLGGTLDPRHVAEPHQVAVLALGERQAREVRRLAVAALDAQREVPVDGLEAACRQLDVLALERVLDVRDGEPAGRERRAVEPDAHRVALPATNAHARDAVERRQAVDDVAVGVVGQLERVHAGSSSC